MPGKSKAPQAFRSAGLVSKLHSVGLDVEEHHALSRPAQYSISDLTTGSIRAHDLNISVCTSVYDTLTTNLIHNTATAPPFQLLLGGECSTTPAILSALSHHSPHTRIGLLYIDADLDLTSPTDADSMGYFAGMTTTHLLRLPGMLNAMARFSSADGGAVCDETNMVFFGTNLSHPGNKNEHVTFLADRGFEVVSSADVVRDAEGAAYRALASLTNSVDVILVHLDVDAIDPRKFPLANVPNFTGVEFEQMMSALGTFMECEKVCGLVIAEVNPDHDPGLGLVERLMERVVGMLEKRKIGVGR